MAYIINTLKIITNHKGNVSTFVINSHTIFDLNAKLSNCSDMVSQSKGPGLDPASNKKKLSTYYLTPIKKKHYR